MGVDMKVPCGDGLINIRAGAIIIKDGKLLMAGNEEADHLYSVGGRIKFGETAEEAVKREVFEETGVHLEVDRLGFIHENYFNGDSDDKGGKVVYEISFFFYMKVPEDFEPVCMSFTEGNVKEYLCWVTPETEKKMYPEFFRTMHYEGVQHMVTDDRKDKE